MVGHNADDGRRILQRFGENVREEVDGVREYVGVIADEDEFVLEHHKRPHIEEGVEGEHAEHRVDPIPDEEGLGLVPVAHEGDVLLVDESQLVLLIEVHLLGLEVPVTVVKQLSHPLHLELAVRLLDRQLDVLLVVLVDRQTLHLHVVYQVPQNLLVESEEGEVRHDAEDSLRDADLQVADVLANVDRLRRVLAGESEDLMPLALDDWFFETGQRGVGAALDDAKRDVELVVLALDPGVVVDADADAEEPAGRVEVVQQFVVVVVLWEFLVGAFEAKDEAF